MQEAYGSQKFPLMYRIIICVPVTFWVHYVSVIEMLPLEVTSREEILVNVPGLMKVVYKIH